MAKKKVSIIYIVLFQSDLNGEMFDAPHFTTLSEAKAHITEMHKDGAVEDCVFIYECKLVMRAEVAGLTFVQEEV